MKKLLSLFLALVVMLSAAPYTFLHQPPAGYWALAGVTGGIPTNRTQSGSTITATSGDRTSTIQTALNTAGSGFTPGSAGKFVLLGAGSFTYSTLNIPSGVTLRGSGKGVTMLVTTHTGGGSGALNMQALSEWPPWSQTPQTVSSAVTAGTTTLTVADASSFTAGRLIRIETANQQNNSSITAGAVPVLKVDSGNSYNRTQIVRLTSKTSTTLTIYPGLLWDSTGLAVRAVPSDPNIYGAGIEDLTLDSSGTSGLAFPVMYWSAQECWMKNVELYHPTSGYGVAMFHAAFMTIKGCWIHGTSGGGSNGSNLLLGGSNDGVCHSLFEDNQLTQGFPNLEVNYGSSGNVFGYNLGYESTSFGANAISFDTNHGPHNSFNLYEGNVVPNIGSDGYFGSASEDTIFRSWIKGVQPGVSDRAALLNKRLTRRYQIIGNRFGGSVSPYAEVGTPNMGNQSYTGTAQPTASDFWTDWPTTAGTGGYQELDLDVAASSTYKGNYYAGSLISGESLGTDTLPDSLYLSSKPAFMGNLTWPLDYTSTSTSPQNAAEYRYNNSQADPPSSITNAPTNYRRHSAGVLAP